MKSRGKKLAKIIPHFICHFSICVNLACIYAPWVQRGSGALSPKNTGTFSFYMGSKAFLSVSRAFTQFAVILHECFKCHTFYSASFKSRLDGKDALFQKEIFSSGSPGIMDLLPITYACTHRKKTHTVWTRYQCLCSAGHKQTRSWRCKCTRSHREVFVSLSLGSTGSGERLFPRSLGLPNGLANALRLQKDLAGRN